jgi:hypothetical protein
MVEGSMLVSLPVGFHAIAMAHEMIRIHGFHKSLTFMKNHGILIMNFIPLNDPSLISRPCHCHLRDSENLLSPSMGHHTTTSLRQKKKAWGGRESSQRILFWALQQIALVYRQNRTRSLEARSTSSLIGFAADACGIS